MKHTILGLLVGGLTLASASPALAAAPATVTVRAENTGGAFIAPTTLTTTTTPVTKDGSHPCSGTSAAGALEQVTGGDWNGTWSDAYSTYSATRIKNEDYGEYNPTNPPQYYWAFTVNDVAADTGICGVELQPGDEVLFYRGCVSATSGCYPYDAKVLSASGPATVKPGEAFAVTVREVWTDYSGSSPVVRRDPAPGATVFAGSQKATTDAEGRAVLNLPESGPVGVRVTKGDTNVPDQYPLCVSDGNDGFCGTSKPSTPAAPCFTRGDDGLCGTADKRAAFGRLTGISEGQRFAKGKGPRELKGVTEADASGIKDVRLRLTRTDAGRCTTYDGRREAFKAMKKCGATRGTWFSVGGDADWRYLLPARLGRGRYVLDLQVVDRAGNADSTLARGRNRLVFSVA